MVCANANPNGMYSDAGCLMACGDKTYGHEVAVCTERGMMLDCDVCEDRRDNGLAVTLRLFSDVEPVGRTRF